MPRYKSPKKKHYLSMTDLERNGLGSKKHWLKIISQQAEDFAKHLKFVVLGGKLDIKIELLDEDYQKLEKRLKSLSLQEGNKLVQGLIVDKVLQAYVNLLEIAKAKKKKDPKLPKFYIISYGLRSEPIKAYAENNS